MTPASGVACRPYLQSPSCYIAASGNDRITIIIIITLMGNILIFSIGIGLTVIIIIAQIIIGVMGMMISIIMAIIGIITIIILMTIIFITLLLN